MEKIDHKLVLDLENLMCNDKRAFRIWNPDLISSGAVLWSWISAQSSCCTVKLNYVFFSIFSTC